MPEGANDQLRPEDERPIDATEQAEARERAVEKAVDRVDGIAQETIGQEDAVRAEIEERTVEIDRELSRELKTLRYNVDLMARRKTIRPHERRYIDRMRDRIQEGKREQEDLRYEVSLVDQVLAKKRFVDEVKKMYEDFEAADSAKLSFTYVLGNIGLTQDEIADLSYELAVNGANYLELQKMQDAMVKAGTLTPSAMRIAVLQLLEKGKAPEEVQLRTRMQVLGGLAPFLSEGSLKAYTELYDLREHSVSFAEGARYIQSLVDATQKLGMTPDVLRMFSDLINGKEADIRKAAEALTFQIEQLEFAEEIQRIDSAISQKQELLSSTLSQYSRTNTFLAELTEDQPWVWHHISLGMLKDLSPEIRSQANASLRLKKTAIDLQSDIQSLQRRLAIEKGKKLTSFDTFTRTADPYTADLALVQESLMLTPDVLGRPENASIKQRVEEAKTRLDETGQTTNLSLIDQELKRRNPQQALRFAVEDANDAVAAKDAREQLDASVGFIASDIQTLEDWKSQMLERYGAKSWEGDFTSVIHSIGSVQIPGQPQRIVGMDGYVARILQGDNAAGIELLHVPQGSMTFEKKKKSGKGHHYKLHRTGYQEYLTLADLAKRGEDGQLYPLDAFGNIVADSNPITLNEEQQSAVELQQESRAGFTIERSSMVILSGRTDRRGEWKDVPVIDIRTADGRVYEGRIMGKGTREKLANPPDGYTAIITKVPDKYVPEQKSYIKKSGQGGQAKRKMYYCECKPQPESILGIDHIAFVREGVDSTEADRSIQLVRNEGDEPKTIHAETFAEADAKQAEVLKVLPHLEPMIALRQGGADILASVGPLQSLLEGGMQGNKTEDFVFAARAQAKHLKSKYDRSLLLTQYQETKKTLATLRTLDIGVISDDFEDAISATEAQLQQIESLLSTNAIDEICDRILSDDFNSDTFWEWMSTYGVILFVTIVGAVLIMTGIGSPLGAVLVKAGVSSGVASVIAGAAGSAIGAYVGGELGKTIVSGYHNGDKFKADYQLAFEGQISISEYFSRMGITLGTNFVTTGLIMGAGQIIGTWARGVAQQGLTTGNAASLASTTAYKEAMARMITRCAGQLAKVEDLINSVKPSARGSLSHLVRETVQEFWEEGVESSFDSGATLASDVGNVMASRILKGCATVFSILNGAKGPGLTSDSDARVIMDSSYLDGDTAHISLTYNESSVDQLRKELASEKKSIVEEVGGGVYTLTSEVDGKTVIRTYKPSSEPEFVRGLQSQTAGEGPSPLQLFGVEYDSDAGEYAYYQSDNIVQLQEYLGAQGIATAPGVEPGTITARYGDESVTFRVKETRSVVADTALEYAENGDVAALESFLARNDVDPSLRLELGRMLLKEGDGELSPLEAKAILEAHAIENTSVENRARKLSVLIKGFARSNIAAGMEVEQALAEAKVDALLITDAHIAGAPTAVVESDTAVDTTTTEADADVRPSPAVEALLSEIESARAEDRAAEIQEGATLARRQIVGAREAGIITSDNADRYLSVLDGNGDPEADANDVFSGALDTEAVIGIATQLDGIYDGDLASLAPEVSTDSTDTIAERYEASPSVEQAQADLNELINERFGDEAPALRALTAEVMRYYDQTDQYHNAEHMLHMTQDIFALANNETLTAQSMRELLVAGLYHDVGNAEHPNTTPGVDELAAAKQFINDAVAATDGPLQTIAGDSDSMQRTTANILGTVFADRHANAEQLAQHSYVQEAAAYLTQQGIDTTADTLAVLMVTPDALAVKNADVFGSLKPENGVINGLKNHSEDTRKDLAALRLFAEKKGADSTAALLLARIEQGGMTAEELRAAVAEAEQGELPGFIALGKTPGQYRAGFKLFLAGEFHKYRNPADTQFRRNASNGRILLETTAEGSRLEVQQQVAREAEEYFDNVVRFDGEINAVMQDLLTEAALASPQENLIAMPISQLATRLSQRMSASAFADYQAAIDAFVSDVGDLSISQMNGGQVNSIFALRYQAAIDGGFVGPDLLAGAPIDLLRQTTNTSDIAGPVLQALVADAEALPDGVNLEVQTFADGEPIVTEGSENDMIYVVVSGRVEISRQLPSQLQRGEATSAPLASMSTGTFFGEISALDADQNATATVRAIGSTQVIGIPAQYATSLRPEGDAGDAVSQLVQTRLQRSEQTLQFIEQEVRRVDAELEDASPNQRFEIELHSRRTSFEAVRTALETDSTVEQVFNALLSEKGFAEAQVTEALSVDILSTDQKRAILLAHYTGLGEPGADGRNFAGINNYTTAQGARKRTHLIGRTPDGKLNKDNPLFTEDQQDVLLNDLQLAGVVPAVIPLSITALDVRRQANTAILDLESDIRSANVTIEKLRAERSRMEPYLNARNESARERFQADVARINEQIIAERSRIAGYQVRIAQLYITAIEYDASSADPAELQKQLSSAVSYVVNLEKLAEEYSVDSAERNEATVAVLQSAATKGRTRIASLHKVYVERLSSITAQDRMPSDAERTIPLIRGYIGLTESHVVETEKKRELGGRIISTLERNSSQRADQLAYHDNAVALLDHTIAADRELTDRYQMEINTRSLARVENDSSASPKDMQHEIFHTKLEAVKMEDRVAEYAAKAAEWASKADAAREAGNTARADLYASLQQRYESMATELSAHVANVDARIQSLQDRRDIALSEITVDEGIDPNAERTVPLLRGGISVERSRITNLEQRRSREQRFVDALARPSRNVVPTLAPRREDADYTVREIDNRIAASEANIVSYTLEIETSLLAAEEGYADLDVDFVNRGVVQAQRRITQMASLREEYAETADQWNEKAQEAAAEGNPIRQRQYEALRDRYLVFVEQLAEQEAQSLVRVIRLAERVHYLEQVTEEEKGLSETALIEQQLSDGRLSFSQVAGQLDSPERVSLLFADHVRVTTSLTPAGVNQALGLAPNENLSIEQKRAILLAHYTAAGEPGADGVRTAGLENYTKTQGARKRAQLIGRTPDGKLNKDNPLFTEAQQDALLNDLQLAGVQPESLHLGKATGRVEALSFLADVGSVEGMTVQQIKNTFTSYGYLEVGDLKALQEAEGLARAEEFAENVEGDETNSLAGRISFAEVDEDSDIAKGAVVRTADGQLVRINAGRRGYYQIEVLADSTSELSDEGVDNLADVVLADDGAVRFAKVGPDVKLAAIENAADVDSALSLRGFDSGIASFAREYENGLQLIDLQPGTPVVYTDANGRRRSGVLRLSPDGDGKMIYGRGDHLVVSITTIAGGVVQNSWVRLEHMRDLRTGVDAASEIERPSTIEAFDAQIADADTGLEVGDKISFTLNGQRVRGRVALASDQDSVVFESSNGGNRIVVEVQNDDGTTTRRRYKTSHVFAGDYTITQRTEPGRDTEIFSFAPEQTWVDQEASTPVQLEEQVVPLVGGQLQKGDVIRYTVNGKDVDAEFQSIDSDGNYVLKVQTTTGAFTTFPMQWVQLQRLSAVKVESAPSQRQLTSIEAGRSIGSESEVSNLSRGDVVTFMYEGQRIVATVEGYVESDSRPGVQRIRLQYTRVNPKTGKKEDVTEKFAMDLVSRGDGVVLREGEQKWASPEQHTRLLQKIAQTTPILRSTVLGKTDRMRAYAAVRNVIIDGGSDLSPAQRQQALQVLLGPDADARVFSLIQQAHDRFPTPLRREIDGEGNSDPVLVAKQRFLLEGLSTLYASNGMTDAQARTEAMRVSRLALHSGLAGDVATAEPSSAEAAISVDGVAWEVSAPFVSGGTVTFDVGTDQYGFNDTFTATDAFVQDGQVWAVGDNSYGTFDRDSLNVTELFGRETALSVLQALDAEAAGEYEAAPEVRTTRKESSVGFIALDSVSIPVDVRTAVSEAVVASQNPSEPWVGFNALLKLGDAQIEQGNHAEAIAIYQQISQVQFDPSHPDYAAAVSNRDVFVKNAERRLARNEVDLATVALSLQEPVKLGDTVYVPISSLDEAVDSPLWQGLAGKRLVLLHNNGDVHSIQHARSLKEFSTDEASFLKTLAKESFADPDSRAETNFREFGGNRIVLDRPVQWTLADGTTEYTTVIEFTYTSNLNDAIEPAAVNSAFNGILPQLKDVMADTGARITTVQAFHTHPSGQRSRSQPYLSSMGQGIHQEGDIVATQGLYQRYQSELPGLYDIEFYAYSLSNGLVFEFDEGQAQGADFSGRSAPERATGTPGARPGGEPPIPRRAPESAVRTNPYAAVHGGDTLTYTVNGDDITVTALGTTETGVNVTMQDSKGKTLNFAMTFDQLAKLNARIEPQQVTVTDTTAEQQTVESLEFDEVITMHAVNSQGKIVRVRAKVIGKTANAVTVRFKNGTERNIDNGRMNAFLRNPNASASTEIFADLAQNASSGNVDELRLALAKTSVSPEQRRALVATIVNLDAASPIVDTILEAHREYPTVIRQVIDGEGNSNPTLVAKQRYLLTALRAQLEADPNFSGDAKTEARRIAELALHSGLAGNPFMNVLNYFTGKSDTDAEVDTADVNVDAVDTDVDKKPEVVEIDPIALQKNPPEGRPLPKDGVYEEFKLKIIDHIEAGGSTAELLAMLEDAELSPDQRFVIAKRFAREYMLHWERLERGNKEGRHFESSEDHDLGDDEALTILSHILGDPANHNPYLLNRLFQIGRISIRQNIDHPLVHHYRVEEGLVDSNPEPDVEPEAQALASDEGLFFTDGSIAPDQDADGSSEDIQVSGESDVEANDSSEVTNVAEMPNASTTGTVEVTENIDQKMGNITTHLQAIGIVGEGDVIEVDRVIGQGGMGRVSSIVVYSPDGTVKRRLAVKEILHPGEGNRKPIQQVHTYRSRLRTEARALKRMNIRAQRRALANVQLYMRGLEQAEQSPTAEDLAPVVAAAIANVSPVNQQEVMSRFTALAGDLNFEAAAREVILAYTRAGPQVYLAPDGSDFANDYIVMDLLENGADADVLNRRLKNPPRPDSPETMAVEAQVNDMTVTEYTQWLTTESERRATARRVYMYQVMQAALNTSEAGLVNRDLKPANTMILPDGTVRIVDTGLAMRSGDMPESSGGTPAYAPPEQIIGGHTITQKSDVYTLGMMLYEYVAISGNTPLIDTLKMNSKRLPRNQMEYLIAVAKLAKSRDGRTFDEAIDMHVGDVRMQNLLKRMLITKPASARITLAEAVAEMRELVGNDLQVGRQYLGTMVDTSLEPVDTEQTVAVANELIGTVANVKITENGEVLIGRRSRGPKKLNIDDIAAYAVLRYPSIVHSEKLGILTQIREGETGFDAIVRKLSQETGVEAEQLEVALLSMIPSETAQTFFPSAEEGE